MKKVHYTDQDIRSFVHNIIRDMRRDNWQPDYIVGLTRGGLTPANMLSQYLEIPMETLKVSLRDSRTQSESNCWMAEDAMGYEKEPVNILVVDDINDSGATIAWIKQDWPGSCLPANEKWNSCWGTNVRFATVVNNLASTETVEYAAMEIILSVPTRIAQW